MTPTDALADALDETIHEYRGLDDLAGQVITRLAETGWVIAPKAWVETRKAREKRARDTYRQRHPDLHRKSARESMARLRAALAETPGEPE